MSREYKQHPANSQEEFFGVRKFAGTVGGVATRSSLADLLRAAAGDTPQKVVVVRSGLTSDQVSKIFSGETKDPRWSTMVPLLRDGLGVSLDAFAGGAASSPLTPYDTNPRYRQLVAGLEEMSKRDRDMVLGFLDWLIELRVDPQRVGAVNPHIAVEPDLSYPAGSPNNQDARRVQETFARLTDAQKLDVFQYLADRDVLEVLQIDRKE